jgi:hypothetical protein
VGVVASLALDVVPHAASTQVMSQGPASHALM